MTQSKNVNPWDILSYRRKIKKFQDTGIAQSMRLLKAVRQMKLDTKMLKCTQFPRVLLWITHKINNQKTTDQAKIKFNKMCKFLFKEWKEQIQEDKQEKKE